MVTLPTSPFSLSPLVLNMSTFGWELFSKKGERGSELSLFRGRSLSSPGGGL